MAKDKDSFLKNVNFAAQIICGNDKCSLHGDPHNVIIFQAGEVASFYESYGNGGEDVEKDSCKECGDLGDLQDLLPSVYFEAFPQKQGESLLFAIALTPTMIDSLLGALNNYEEGTNNAVVTLSPDAVGFNLDDAFYFTDFQQLELLDPNKDNTNFVEQNKTIICSTRGICLSVEAEQKQPVTEVKKGENPPPPYQYFQKDDHAVYTTFWMTKENLLEIRGILISQAFLK